MNVVLPFTRVVPADGALDVVSPFVPRMAAVSHGSIHQATVLPESPVPPAPAEAGELDANQPRLHHCDDVSLQKIQHAFRSIEEVTDQLEAIQRALRSVVGLPAAAGKAEGSETCVSTTRV